MLSSDVFEFTQLFYYGKAFISHSSLYIALRLVQTDLHSIVDTKDKKGEQLWFDWLNYPD